jgi:Putative DNA-binding domain
VPTLREVQEAVKDFMLGGSTSAADFVIDDGIAPEDRLGIYRNTFISVLVAALRISYPAIRRLVGEDFFEGAARAFIDAQPPDGAYLNAYGARFGDFLDSFPPAAGLAYLPDVARLEWAVNVALHAGDAPPLDVGRLATLGEADVSFITHPSVSLLTLDHPADSIWRAVIDGDDDALGATDPAAGPVFLLVSRGAGGVSVERLAEDAWKFSARLFSGVPLSRALDAADRDMSRDLAEHLAAGRVTDFRMSEKRNDP